MPPKPRKKPPQNVWSIFFESKGVKFINIAWILHDPGIVKSLSSSSVKFPMPVVTYKLTPRISSKFFSFKVGIVKLMTNNVKIKTDERMSHLANNLYANKHRYCLSSRDVKNALYNLHKDFVVAPIDKGAGIIALVYKRFYASVITTEFVLNNNSSADTYSNTNGLYTNDIIEKMLTI